MCSSTYSPAVQVVVNSTSAPSGDSIQTFNFSSPVFVSNLVVSGDNIKWYSTNLDALSNTNSLVLSNTIALGSTYYAMQYLNGCYSISPLAVTVTSSLLTDGFNAEKFEIYPNPFKTHLKLKYSKTIDSVEFFNNLGQSVFKNNIGVKEATLSLDHLLPGIYYMRLSTKDNKGVVKVIKI